MKNQIPRRIFLKRSSAACLGGCLLMHRATAMASNPFQDQPIDPASLNYCAYKCPEECEFLVASQKNDPELKKAAYEQWKLKERHGLEFDPEKIFCFRCKPGDKPEGPVLTHCTVRACAIEKGYQACIQCDELKECDKDLWSRFPDFHKSVIEMQKAYREQEA